MAADGYVCLLEASLHVEDSGSLKSKRKVVRSLKDSVRRRFGATGAEVGGPETWQRSELLIALVGGPEVVTRGEEVERYIRSRVGDGVTFERHLRSMDDLR